jgi:hypothetical protein
VANNVDVMDSPLPKDEGGSKSLRYCESSLTPAFRALPEQDGQDAGRDAGVDFVLINEENVVDACARDGGHKVESPFSTQKYSQRIRQVQGTDIPASR